MKQVAVRGWGSPADPVVGVALPPGFLWEIIGSASPEMIAAVARLNEETVSLPAFEVESRGKADP